MVIHGINSEESFGRALVEDHRDNFTQLDVSNQLSNDRNREYYMVAGVEEPKETKI